MQQSHINYDQSLSPKVLALPYLDYISKSWQKQGIIVEHAYLSEVCPFYMKITSKHIVPKI